MKNSNTKILIDGESLTLERAVAVAQGAEIVLAQSAKHRIDHALSKKKKKKKKKWLHTSSSSFANVSTKERA